MSLRPFAFVFPILAACDLHDDQLTRVDATMGSDGYALFEVSNRDPQGTEMIVHVRDAEPNATYALVFAADAPASAGWFELDLVGPRAPLPCAGDVLAPACRLPRGFGWLVDVARAPAAGGTVVLHSERREDETEHDGMKGHWAVLRVERTGKQGCLSLEVWGKEGRTGRANEPAVRQLF
jgi:hypothetical protein